MWLAHNSYAPGIVPQGEAAKEGYGQILWLSGEDHMLTEASLQYPACEGNSPADHQVGTMNLFVCLKTADGGAEIVTAPLGDLVLPGVTRDRWVLAPQLLSPIH